MYLADAPHSSELLERMNARYQYEAEVNRKDSRAYAIRMHWYPLLQGFIDSVLTKRRNDEERLFDTFRHDNPTAVPSNSGLDVEYLLSRLDLAIQSPGKLVFEKSGVDTEPRQFPWEPLFSMQELEEIAMILRTYLYEVLGPRGLSLDTNRAQRLAAKLKSLREDSASLQFISLNYDILLEQLLEQLGFWSLPDGYGCSVRSNSVGPITRKQMLAGVPDTTCPVFKLHGSVTWEPDLLTHEVNIRTHDFEAGRPFYSWLPCQEPGGKPYQGKVPFMCMLPSYVKTFTHPVFGEIWRKAHDALYESDHVIILGYSFPEADSMIRVLLMAIRKAACVTVVDIKPDPVVERLRDVGVEAHHMLPSLEHWISA
jgi:hypothetical protein